MKPLLALLGACASCLLLLPAWSAAGEPIGLITIHSVPATIIRDATKFDGVQGLALQADDIVETYPFATLTRLEFKDGTILDIGPSSRVMLKPQWPGSNNGDGPLVYVLDGWAKLSTSPGGQARKPVLATSHLDLTRVTRNVVLHVKAGEAEAFAESGQVSAQFRREGVAGALVNLEPGAYLVRQADGTERVQPRPTAAFAQAVPAPFRDTLPSRVARFDGKLLNASRGTRIGYVDVEGWLTAEPRMRARFVTRWRSLAQDSAFRQSLVAHLAQHPEWRPVLYPPSQPSHQPANARAAASAPGFAASHP